MLLAINIASSKMVLNYPPFHHETSLGHLHPLAKQKVQKKLEDEVKELHQEDHQSWPGNEFDTDMF